MFFYSLPIETCHNLYQLVGNVLRDVGGHDLANELNEIFKQKHSGLPLNNPLKYLDMRKELVRSLKPAITSFILDNILKSIWEKRSPVDTINKINNSHFLLDLKYRYDYIDFLFGENNTQMIHENADEHTFYNIVDRYIVGVINQLYREPVKNAMLDFIMNIANDDILLKNKILLANVFRNDYVLVVLKRRQDESGEVFPR